MPRIAGLRMEEELPFVAKEDDNSTSLFLMYGYKVIACSKRYRHDWSVCPFAHQGEMAARRDPRTYLPMFCYYSKQRIPCPRGDTCQHAHNLFEYWLHPARYRTQLCQFGTSCSRPVCFFAHGKQQVRNTGMPGGTTPVVAPPEPLAVNLGPSGLAGLTNPGRTSPDFMAAEHQLASRAGGMRSGSAAALQHQHQLLQMQAGMHAGRPYVGHHQQQQGFALSNGMLPTLNAPPVGAEDSWNLAMSAGTLQHMHSVPATSPSTALPPPLMRAQTEHEQQVIATMQQLAAAVQHQPQSQAMQQQQARTPMTVELFFDQPAMQPNSGPQGSNSAPSSAVSTEALLEELLARQLSTASLSTPALPQLSMPPAARTSGSVKTSCPLPLAASAAATMGALVAPPRGNPGSPRGAPAASGRSLLAGAGSRSQAIRAVTPEDQRVDALSRLHNWSAPVSPTSDLAGAAAPGGSGAASTPALLVVGGEALTAGDVRKQLQSPPPATYPELPAATASDDPIGPELAAQLLAALPQSSVAQLLDLMVQQQQRAAQYSARQV